MWPGERLRVGRRRPGRWSRGRAAARNFVAPELAPRIWHKLLPRSPASVRAPSSAAPPPTRRARAATSSSAPHLHHTSRRTLAAPFRLSHAAAPCCSRLQSSCACRLRAARGRRRQHTPGLAPRRSSPRCRLLARPLPRRRQHGLASQHRLHHHCCISGLLQGRLSTARWRSTRRRLCPRPVRVRPHRCRPRCARAICLPRRRSCSTAHGHRAV